MFIYTSSIKLCILCSAAKTSTGVIRVINSETSARVLIRGMEGLVQDIAFAHIMNHVILASVDEKGNLFIHRVLESKDSETALESELLLHVIQDSDLDYCGPHRVIWCPFIPDDDTKSPGEIIEDVSTLLVLTRGTKVGWSFRAFIVVDPGASS